MSWNDSCHVCVCFCCLFQQIGLVLGGVGRVSLWYDQRMDHCMLHLYDGSHERWPSVHVHHSIHVCWLACPVLQTLFWAWMHSDRTCLISGKGEALRDGDDTSRSWLDMLKSGRQAEWCGGDVITTSKSGIMFLGMTMSLKGFHASCGLRITLGLAEAVRNFWKCTVTSSVATCCLRQNFTLPWKSKICTCKVSRHLFKLEHSVCLYTHLLLAMVLGAWRFLVNACAVIEMIESAKVRSWLTGGIRMWENKDLEPSRRNS